MDVIHGEVHKNIERICKKLEHARGMHYRVLHCKRGYEILFRVFGQCQNNWDSKGGVKERIESRSGIKVILTNYKALCEAHYYVLQNTTVVNPYRYEHLSFI